MSAAPSSLNTVFLPDPQPVPDVLRWHAVYTYPRHERSVYDELTSRSVEAFLPALLKKSRWKDRTVTLQTPLFPGYVFTRMHAGQRRTILSALGVVRILCFNGEMAIVEDAEIAAVKLVLERGASVEHGSSFEVGESVRVITGVLAGLEGRISRSKGKRRLLIPITLLQQSVAVDVAMEDLELIVRS